MGTQHETKVERIESRYDINLLNIGIVHIGLGAFHRAHQAVFIERWLNKNGGGDWAICSANIRSNHALVDLLKNQACKYHVAEFQDATKVTLREVNAIREVIYAGENKQSLLEKLSHEKIKIVTLTVTEKGYSMIPAEKRLRIEDENVQHDLVLDESDPKTVPGLIVEALRRRKQRGIEPFTVLSCDNMPDNGVMVREAVLQLASARNSALAEWIEERVAFPCSMVDQIVPAMDNSAFHKLASELNCHDQAAVITEAFTQWVVEDNFPTGRPDWESVGVEMVEDVRPFETMKLRLLNGSHSLLAYLGCLESWTTVFEAVSKPEIKNLLFAYMAEAAGSDGMPKNVDIDKYCRSLVCRFSNDSLQHRLQQIAMDGSQKILQRWLFGAENLLQRHCSVSLTALGVAAWIRYVKGTDLEQNRYEVSDPMAHRFSTIHDENLEAEALVQRFFSLTEIFPKYVSEHLSFREQVVENYRSLNSRGVLKTVEIALSGHRA